MGSPTAGWSLATGSSPLCGQPQRGLVADIGRRPISMIDIGRRPISLIDIGRRPISIKFTGKYTL
jgi:hypothetical protein